MDPIHFTAARAVRPHPLAGDENDFYERHSFERWHALVTRMRRIAVGAARLWKSVHRRPRRVNIAHAR